MRILILLFAILPAWAQSARAGVELHDLREPIDVITFDMYEDGGTWGGMLRDADGRTLGFGKDGRLRQYLFGESPPPGNDDPWLFFIGGDYPTRPGVRMLGVGSKQEAKLLKILNGWIVRELPSPRWDETVRAYRAAGTYTRKDEIAREHRLSDRKQWVLDVDSAVNSHAKKYKLDAGSR